MIAVYDIIDYILGTDCFEVLSCAMDFRFFHQAKLHRGHRAFRLGNKVNVFYFALIESDCPVGIVASYRSGDIKAVRQFYIYGDVRICILLLRKFLLICRIIHNMVIQMFFRFHGICTEFTLDGRIRKYICLVMLVQCIIGNVLNDSGRFFIIDYRA